MTSFTDIFGGSAISPAEVAFAEYTFSEDLVLYWPSFANGQPDVAARFMNLTASASSLSAFMPDATLVSVGYDAVVFNPGSNTLDVVDYDGGAIANISAGQTYYILLTDNSTQAGTWQIVQFGVGTSSADAAALAGAGLLASAGLLNVNFNAQSHAASYMISPASRALLQVWTGGSGTITLPTAASVGNGFFFPLANNGSGSAVVTPSGGNTIDGEVTSTFTQGQSGFIVSSGSEWFTVGKGSQSNFSVTLLNLNVAGDSDVVETSAQAQNVIQQLTGTLTDNINVIVPDTVQLYYIFNDTGGAFTLTFKTASGSGFVIPQGEHVILYCDGTDVVSAFTSTVQVLGTPTYSLGVVGGTPNALTGSASNFVLQLGTVVWFTPLSANSAPATLNVQSTGVISIRKITPSGLVVLETRDLSPLVPVVAYYDGTYWVYINKVYDGTYENIVTTKTISFADYKDSIVATGATDVTLTSTAFFPAYFNASLFAQGGDITLIPAVADSIQGGAAGDSYVMPQGTSAQLTTNGAGQWTLFFLQTEPSITDDTTTNATMYPTWVTAATGVLPLNVSSTKLTFNPSTGVLNALGGFAGNAATATALETARTIGGVSFNGTANITVATATGGFTVSGGNLALGTNSITMSGSIGVTGTRVTKGWFTDLEVTNAIAGSVTGNAATVTTNANLTGVVTSVGNATSFAAIAANSFLANATSGSAAPAAAVALSASQLAGRGSTGNLAAITLGTNLTMSGTTLNATSVLTKTYTSTGQAITANTTLTLAHGLGVEPKVTPMFVLQCTTGDQGYSIGDRIVVNPAFNGNSGSDYGFTAQVDATNITIIISTASAFVINNKSTRVQGVITLASWQLYVKAYA